MQNQFKYDLLLVLNKLCQDGYNTIDKQDILDSLQQDFNLNINQDVLDEKITEFHQDKLVVLKYLDKQSYCLSLTDEAKSLIEKYLQYKKMLASKQLSQKENFEDFKVTNQIATTATISKKPKTNLKTFLIGLLGGIFGGALSGAIIAIIQLFI